MQKGTRWIYRGEVAWGRKGETVLRKRLDWTMEVVDTVERGRYHAALILGHPEDLIWYREGRTRRWHILIAVDHSEFYLRDYKPPASPERLNISEADLSGLIDEESLILNSRRQ